MAARVRLDRAALDRLLRQPGGPVHDHVTALTRRTETRAKLNIRVRTGTTRASITSSVRTRGTLVIGRVWTPSKVGWWLHEGTGIYGPRGRPIRPVRAQFLRFEVGGRIVYARQVRGMPGDQWLVRALRQTVPYPVVER
ncbi:HK97 gp10 family phage protein [Thermomonospora cellulosilytica]|uniref:Uncharacterized protein n=1 Tax=Thermomonospora cellulosilytica TaxID=1411118 RepID=A0A7W3N1R6_9ACTN|nr:HK97 gp10 family phage protein [Thermomonospora cellulosilytica]MBA9005934.1 hypothetical protein [Thermomonospora cellulosilytica]